MHDEILERPLGYIKPLKVSPKVDSVMLMSSGLQNTLTSFTTSLKSFFKIKKILFVS